ncbi:MAG TPA: hypothetical protein ENH34_00555 [Phycisphaerales bacterium]|nr:hypothetical protein [Phycisphaerales bacterium]
MNKLPPAIYAYILWMIIVVGMVFVVAPIVVSIKNSDVWGFWSIPLLIVAVCFIVYRFRSKKLSNNKTKDDQKQ